MNNTFYTYNGLLDFVNDIIKNKRLWTKYGLIHSFTISNILTPFSEGYISLMIRNNNIVQNLNKYVFSLATFKAVIFSNEVHGIEIYRKKFPLKTIAQVLAEWQNLSTFEKDEYLDLGLKLTDELDKFPTFPFPDIIINPLPQEVVNTEILSLNQTFRLNTGLHKFSINDEILFNIYFDYFKSEFVITNMSSVITNQKDNENTINVYIENSNAFIQNMLEESIYIKKYSSYV